MIFFISIRAAVLAAAALIAGAAAATPYQSPQVDAGQIPLSTCSLAGGDSCDNMAVLVDIVAAEQSHPAALYQDLLTPLEDGHAASREPASLTVKAPAPVKTADALPLSEPRPYTMLLVGLGLLMFSSRKKTMAKFID